MSRIGKKPILIPENVEVEINDTLVRVKGPKGQLSRVIPSGIKVKRENNEIIVARTSESKLCKSLHGLVRTLLFNMVKGVTEGYEKVLEMVGIGYRAVKKGNDLEIFVGYSHPVLIKKPEGIDLEVPSPNTIIVRGIDKEEVGRISAAIRAVRKPEPYKGKGIKYQGELIRRKAGKASKK